MYAIMSLSHPHTQRRQNNKKSPLKAPDPKSPDTVFKKNQNNLRLMIGNLLEAHSFDF